MIRLEPSGGNMKSFGRIALALGLAIIACASALAQAKLGPYVVDSSGLKVGHVIGGAAILMFVDGNPTEVSAGPSGFTASTFNLYFTDGACSTQALQNVGESGVFYALGHYTTDGVIRYVNAASTA